MLLQTLKNSTSNLLYVYYPDTIRRLHNAFVVSGKRNGLTTLVIVIYNIIIVLLISYSTIIFHISCLWLVMGSIIVADVCPYALDLEIYSLFRGVKILILNLF